MKFASNTPYAIHWFRNGLRVHDNVALATAQSRIRAYAHAHAHASSLPKPRLVLLYVVDATSQEYQRIGSNRWRFICEALADLRRSVAQLGGTLIVVRGEALDILQTLSAASQPEILTYEIDQGDALSVARDAKVVAWAKSKRIDIVAECGHTLYDYSLTSGIGKCPKTYVSFLALTAKQAKVSKPLPVPEYILTAPDINSHPDLFEIIQNISLDDQQLRELKIGGEVILPDNPFAKRLKSITQRPAFGSTSYFIGGETEGLRRMHEYLSDKAAVRSFEKPLTSPSALVPSTTALSPYLHFGCVSIRSFYWAIRAVIDGYASATEPPTSLIGQIMFREFFHHIGAATPHFDRIEGNAICRQIDWTPAGSEKEKKFLYAWRNAKTGFPWIDALMTQLRIHGWMHHLGRHSVACFLTRGDLYISWERGREVFDEWLIDADWSSNNANWMWLSASAFFNQYWKVYSPIIFAQKGDMDGTFIRHFIPALRKMPQKYIYAPWTAPYAVQVAAECIIGVDYPKPIIEDHAALAKTNIGKLKEAYAKSQLTAGKKQVKRKNNSKNSGSDSDSDE
jgi:cryptochrome